LEWGDDLQRRFAIIGHRAPSVGNLNLNDLPGSGGRVDVLTRAINSALFVSHGIREDTQIVLHMMGGNGPPRRILFDGSRLGGVRPDERSIAGQIKSVMKNEIPPIGNYVQCSRGISHSGGGPEQTMAEWLRDGFKCYLLDASGFPSSNIESGDKMGFFLSDDLPMNDNDKSQIGGLDRVSLGEMWLQGHSCIAIVHHILDSH